MQSIYFLQSNDKHYNLLQQKLNVAFSTVVSAQNLTLNFWHQFHLRNRD